MKENSNPAADGVNRIHMDISAARVVCWRDWEWRARVECLAAQREPQDVLVIRIDHAQCIFDDRDLMTAVVEARDENCRIGQAVIVKLQAHDSA